MVSSVIVVHGGSWNDNIYEGGRRDFIPIPSNGISFEELLSKVEVRLKKDGTTNVFDIDALIQLQSGDMSRMKISDNFEWSYLKELVDVPTIYVSVCNRHNQSEYSSIIQMNSGNVVDRTDSGGVDSYNVYTLDNSGDSSAAYGSAFGRWVIPGASYHASIPCDEMVIDPEPVIGELVSGSTFCSKDAMVSAIAVYHLKNCLEFRTKVSDTERYHNVCKFAESCKFSVRSRSLGQSWKIYKWIPHTCERDLRRAPHPKVSSRAIAVHVGANMSEDGCVLRPRDIQGQILREFGVNLKYSAALAGRNLAFNMTYGDQDKSFQVYTHTTFLILCPVCYCYAVRNCVFLYCVLVCECYAVRNCMCLYCVPSSNCFGCCV